MKILALFFLIFFTSIASVQLRAEDAYDAELKELQLKADALQADADIANEKAKRESTPKNMAAADAANIAAAEAVMDIAIHSVPKAIDAYSSKPTSQSTPEPEKRAEKAEKTHNSSADYQYTSIVILTNDLFLVGADKADMATSIKNLGPKSRQIDISICGFHVNWKTTEKLINELKVSGYNRIGLVADGGYLIKEVCANYAIKGTSE